MNPALFNCCALKLYRFLPDLDLKAFVVSTICIELLQAVLNLLCSLCVGDTVLHGTDMNKRALIRKIVARLTEELEVYFRAAQASRAEATHEQSKAENKYDTRGLEASYLARGQSKQAAEIQGAIAAFEKLDARRFGAGEPIAAGAFVELELDGEKAAYFIGPRAGGTEVLHEKREVLVITPQSPLGEQLLGRKQGEVLKLKLANSQNQCRVTIVA
jgi:transcription elongation GreA/GreB family factor